MTPTLTHLEALMKLHPDGPRSKEKMLSFLYILKWGRYFY